MDNKSIQDLLNRNGFNAGPADGDLGPRSQEAIRRFQGAHAFNYLEIDGIAGPATQAALGRLPYLAPHFQASEMACHHCGDVRVVRELLSGLEILRGRIGPVSIIDCYRCPTHNAQIKGSASDSMHLYGAAADLGTMPDVGLTLGLRVFSGIGRRGNRASHVDVRHVMGPINKTPDATPDRPAAWAY